MKTLQNPQKIPNLKPRHSKESMLKTSTGPVGYFTDFTALKKSNKKQNKPFYSEMISSQNCQIRNDFKFFRNIFTIQDKFRLIALGQCT